MKTPCLFVSTGCPSGIGPEVSIAAALGLRGLPVVLVGDERVLLSTASALGVAEGRFRRFEAGAPLEARSVYLHAAGPVLRPADCVPGRPGRRAGQAQLAYLAEAFRLTKALPGSALVTAPVSKAAIARSGAPGSAAFRGHTEWLQAVDRARSTVMCFHGPKLSTSLATTHLPLSKVARRLTKVAVRDASLALARLLALLEERPPRIAVCALNPHAGEDALFGGEEASAILPGIRLARKVLASPIELVGPLGAETAFRKAKAGEFQGVVAMYHDQATIPMKLVSFGEAVNVTMGLSIVRTSVDHGTGYDIAGQGKASAVGMLSALRLAARLARAEQASDLSRRPPAV